MIGVLIKSGETVVDKQVFDGDETISLALIADYQTGHPELTAEVHRDSDEDWAEAFDQIEIAPQLTQVQMDWLVAKGNGTAAAVAFIAKHLGLE